MIFGQPLSIFFSIPWIIAYIEVGLIAYAVWQVVAALNRIGKGLSEVADAVRQPPPQP